MAGQRFSARHPNFERLAAKAAPFVFACIHLLLVVETPAAFLVRTRHQDDGVNCHAKIRDSAHNSLRKLTVSPAVPSFRAFGVKKDCSMYFGAARQRVGTRIGILGLEN